MTKVACRDMLCNIFSLYFASNTRVLTLFIFNVNHQLTKQRLLWSYFVRFCSGKEATTTAIARNGRNRPLRRPLRRPRDDRATTARRLCNRRDSGVSRGDGCESERCEASADERNRPLRRPRDDIRISSTFVAQRGIILYARDSNPFRKGLQSFPQGTAVLCAKDYQPLRRNSLGRRCGRLRSYQTPLRSVLHSHPSPLLAPLSRRLQCRRRAVFAAQSSLRAITFVQHSAALRFVLTSIAPTRAAIASVAMSSTCGRRSSVVAAGDYVRATLRCAPFCTHIHRPYSRRYRVGCNVVAPTRLGRKVVDTKSQLWSINS
jgi:hypothetical protein